MVRGLAALLVVVIISIAAVYWMTREEGNGAPPAGLADLATGEMESFELIPPRAVPADLTFVDGAGDELTLNSFEGQTVLLNIWATWCAPCLHEMPALDALEAELGSDQFQVVALSVDKDGVDKARDFLTRIKADHLKLYVDPTGRAAMRLGAFGLPTTFLINPDGQIIGQLVGAAEWNSEDAKALITAALTN